MMASLYPDAARRRRDARSWPGITDIADRRTDSFGRPDPAVRFAVAMVSNPDLLVLDEPTVAMDVEARVQFWQTMRRFAARGKTVLFATHYLEEADAYADRIVLMARGEVVADGPATEIKAAAGGRIIRATLPGAPAARLEPLDGVRRSSCTARRHPQLLRLRRRRECAPGLDRPVAGDDRTVDRRACCPSSPSASPLVTC